MPNYLMAESRGTDLSVGGENATEHAGLKGGDVGVGEHLHQYPTRDGCRLLWKQRYVVPIITKQYVSNSNQCDCSDDVRRPAHRSLVAFLF